MEKVLLVRTRSRRSRRRFDHGRRGLLGIESSGSRGDRSHPRRASKDFQPPPNEPFERFDTLRGSTIVNLFFEASTRTRTSFEIAAKRLGADTLSITASGSSVSKGESLVDTLNTLGAMRPDAIVMRHAASGAPHFLVAPSAHSDHQRRRRHARASDAGAARCAHDSRPPRHAGRPAGGDHRRHRAQPRGAVERPSCFRNSARRSCCAARLRCCRANSASSRPASS